MASIPARYRDAVNRLNNVLRAEGLPDGSFLPGKRHCAFHFIDANGERRKIPLAGSASDRRHALKNTMSLLRNMARGVRHNGH
jgi:hypothetical protein